MITTRILVYGERPRNVAKMNELSEIGCVSLKLYDCQTIDTEQRYLNLAGENTGRVKGAYYSPVVWLKVTDPVRSEQY